MKQYNSMVRRILVAAVTAAYSISLANGFASPRRMMSTSTAARCDPASLHHICHKSFAPPLQHKANTSLNNNNNNNLENDTQQENLTPVGSKEYYQGFLTRSPDQESVERVTGDAVLGPTLKFAGGVSLILVGLVFVFLVSNGLL